jgi:hypothetical protein
VRWVLGIVLFVGAALVGLLHGLFDPEASV